MFKTVSLILGSLLFFSSQSSGSAMTPAGLLDSRDQEIRRDSKSEPLRLAQRRTVQRKQYNTGRRRKRNVEGLMSNSRRMSPQRAQKVRRQIMRGQIRRRNLMQLRNRQRVRRQHFISQQRIRNQTIRRTQRDARRRDRIRRQQLSDKRRRYQNRRSVQRQFERDVRRYGTKMACEMRGLRYRYRHPGAVRSFGPNTSNYGSACGTRG